MSKPLVKHNLQLDPILVRIGTTMFTWIYRGPQYRKKGNFTYSFPFRQMPI